MKKELTTTQKAELLGLGYRGGYTIGDLIEFLREKDAFKSEFGHDPMLVVDTENGYVALDWFRDEDTELCDALFEAVKEVLEK